MRLLEVGQDDSFSLTDAASTHAARYAILSHTWKGGGQEVTFRDLLDGRGQDKTSYRKLDFCRRQSKLDGISHFWVDSVCIDRSSSAELTEAINSMFRWYRDAVKCYVYLSDVPTDDANRIAFRRSRWFRRGWTLQELLAPHVVEFFSCEGHKIGDKTSLEAEIQEITGIPLQALRDRDSISQFSVDDRMSWAAKRETTIDEDRAYCLLGIFGVYMPYIYGEGRENAMRRLGDKIQKANARQIQQQKSASSRERTESCLSSLHPTDQKRDHMAALYYSENACEWILDHQKYLAWHEGRGSSLIVITAKAGYGKTTLAAHLCQTVSKSRGEVVGNVTSDDSLDSVMLYFFFQRSNHDATKTATAAFRTIIAQLVRQMPPVLPVLLARYNILSSEDEFSWSWENLSSVLSQMLEKLKPGTRVYIILDALDECELESRALLMDWIRLYLMDKTSFTVSEATKAVLKVLITSRPDGDTTDDLSSFPRLDITAADTKSDIRALINNRVCDLAQRRHLSPEATHKITDFLESNNHGMFLWVVLIMKELERRDERLSDEVISTKLTSTPLTLQATYISILESCPQHRKADMWRILRWLLFASRSLTLAELQASMCLETATSNWYDFVGDVQYLCGSLIRIHGPLDMVSFVHPTARDFLETSTRSPHFTASSEVALDYREAHESLAAVCVEHLLKTKCLLGLNPAMDMSPSIRAYLNDMNEHLNRHPFNRYAVDSWDYHLRSAGALSSSTWRLVYRFLQRGYNRDRLMALTYFTRKGVSWGIPVNSSPLHIVSYFGLPWLVQMFISKDRSLVRETSDAGDTSLIWASEMGNTACVQALLESNANPNDFEWDGWSALHWAARNGHLDVTRVLLERGAILNPKDSKGHTPLHWAIDREHWDVAAFLERWSQQPDSAASEDLLRLWEVNETLKRTHETRDSQQLWDSRP